MNFKIVKNDELCLLSNQMGTLNINEGDREKLLNKIQNLKKKY